MTSPDYKQQKSALQFSTRRAAVSGILLAAAFTAGWRLIDKTAQDQGPKVRFSDSEGRKSRDYSKERLRHAERRLERLLDSKTTSKDNLSGNQADHAAAKTLTDHERNKRINSLLKQLGSAGETGKRVYRLTYAKQLDWLLAILEALNEERVTAAELDALIRKHSKQMGESSKKHVAFSDQLVKDAQSRRASDADIIRSNFNQGLREFEIGSTWYHIAEANSIEQNARFRARDFKASPFMNSSISARDSNGAIILPSKWRIRMVLSPAGDLTRTYGAYTKARDLWRMPMRRWLYERVGPLRWR